MNRFQFKEDETGYLDQRRDHLYLFDPSSQKAEILTPGEYNETAPSWSPDSRSIADRIVTPTLFLCGDEDFNVPLLNSEQMYQALRSLRRETELVIYPGEYHEIRKPSYRRDRLQRYLDWYGRYLTKQGAQAATH